MPYINSSLNLYHNLDNNIFKSLRLKLSFRTTLNVYTGHVPLVHGSKLGITIDGSLNIIIFSPVPIVGLHY